MTERKFKVGDPVVISNCILELNGDEEYPSKEHEFSLCLTDIMKTYVGKQTTILDVDLFGYVLDDCNGYIWLAEWLEPYSENHLQEKREALMKQIEEIDKEIYHSRCVNIQADVWLPKPYSSKPNHDTVYYVVSSIERDDATTDYYHWDGSGDEIDLENFEKGNCFKTEDDAQKWLDYFKSLFVKPIA